MDSGNRKRRPRTRTTRKSGPIFTSDKVKKNTKVAHPDGAAGKKSFDDPGKKRKSPFIEDIAGGRTEDNEPQQSKSSGDNTTRLNKFIASSGICSRREADEHIAAGKIMVNDKVVTEMGIKVTPEDKVKFNGKIIRAEKKVYILLNKPKDYVTTLDDPEGRKTVMELVKDAGKERVYPVGRLDRNTTGVLLLTNDGELASRLTHPKYEQKKIYHVFIDRDMNLQDFRKLAAGLKLSDGFIRPDGVSFVNPDSKAELGIEIHSGRNRIVRRMLEAINYKVVRLDRVYFAGLTKKNVPRGKWRFLEDKEINVLKMSKKTS